MIVSDAGPIIIFARIGRLPLLRDVTGLLIIPAAVQAEITVNKGVMPGAAEVAEAKWIHSIAVDDRALLDALPVGLHQGEREAIALAKARSAQLLIDEIRGRRVATQLGVEVIGTLRILAEAKKLGYIEAVRRLVLEMQANRYRFDVVLIRRFLESIGEA